MSRPAVRAKWDVSSGYPDGWCVRVTVGQQSIGRYYAANGGEWELDRHGAQGRQLVGLSTIDGAALAKEAQR